MIVSTLHASILLVGCFIVLVAMRVPVAFALGVATIPVVLLDLRLTPFLIMDRMFQSYNSFILLAVPFFLLAANLMNSGKTTDRLNLPAFSPAGCRAGSARSMLPCRCCLPASPALPRRMPPAVAES